MFENTHRTDNVMESLNHLLSSQIMGNTKFNRFYLGLRQIEKTKARDGKLAKDTGGASKSKQKIVTKVSFLILQIKTLSNWHHLIVKLNLICDRLGISSFTMLIQLWNLERLTLKTFWIVWRANMTDFAKKSMTVAWHS